MILILFLFLFPIILYKLLLSIKYPFWSKQPVFHIHNILYYFTYHKGDYIQSPDFKPIQKYYHPSKIKLIQIDDDFSKLYIIDKYFEIIQKHYLKNKNSKFNPSNKYLNDMINNYGNYIALYTGRDILHEKNNSLQITNVRSGLTSKMLMYYTFNKSPLYMNYVDFLCTHTKYRKQNITPTLIYTFAQSLIQNNKKQYNNSIKSNIFLFKREEAKHSAIVPLTWYYNYVFDIKHIRYAYIKHLKNKNNLVYEPRINILTVNDSNYDFFIRTFEQLKLKTKILCLGYDVLKHYINSNIIKVHIAYINDNPLAIYVYKNNSLHYCNKKVFELMSSFELLSSPEYYDKYKGINRNHPLLVDYFYISCKKLCEEEENIGYINIEKLSHNDYIIMDLKSKTEEIHKYINNYYLYNYVLQNTSSNWFFTIF